MHMRCDACVMYVLLCVGVVCECDGVSYITIPAVCTVCVMLCVYLCCVVVVFCVCV